MLDKMQIRKRQNTIHKHEHMFERTHGVRERFREIVAAARFICPFHSNFNNSVASSSTVLAHMQMMAQCVFLSALVPLSGSLEHVS